MEQPKSLKEKDIKQVIVLRKDLNMRKGKMAAQASHASMAVIFNYMSPNYLKPSFGERKERFHFDIDLPSDERGNPFGKTKILQIEDNSPIDKWINGIFKKIVVGAESLSELVNAYEAAKKAGIPCSLIEDKGLTEFGGEITITAAAIGPDDPDKIDEITGKLTLL